MSKEITEEEFLAALPDPGMKGTQHAIIALYLHQEKRMAFEGGREHAKNGRGVGLILKTTALRFADFEDYEAWRKE